MAELVQEAVHVRGAVSVSSLVAVVGRRGNGSVGWRCGLRIRIPVCRWWCCCGGGAAVLLVGGAIDEDGCGALGAGVVEVPGCDAVEEIERW